MRKGQMGHANGLLLQDQSLNPNKQLCIEDRKISTWNVWKGFLCNKSPHDFKRDPVSCITCELCKQLNHSRVWPPSTVLDSLDHSDHALILTLLFEPGDCSTCLDTEEERLLGQCGCVCLVLGKGKHNAKHRCYTRWSHHKHCIGPS